MWDENVKLLSDFLFRFCTQADVEIEGKLGLVYNRKTQKRVHIDGVKSLVCCATDEIDASFAAEIDANMFRHFNEDLLQRRFLDDQAKAKAANARPHWRYAHTRLTDKFHTVGNDRVRVSYDTNGAVVECIVKDKLEHVDFWNGKAKAIDFRISASRERKGLHTQAQSKQTEDARASSTCSPLLALTCAVPVPVPLSAPDQIRRKDRMSYRYDLWSIELTKVDLFTALASNGEPVSAQPASTTFEVEVEIREMEYLRREAAKVRAGAPNEFVKVATAMIDQMRTLSQYAFPGTLPPHMRLTPQAQAQAAANQAAQAAQAAAAQASSKRKREEEESAAANQQEFGRSWS